MRPLISTGDPKKSVDISRKAELYETSSGLITITGGKLTTWRRMAKQTVDRLVEREGREAPCHTAEIPLGMEARPEDLEAPEGVGEESVKQLAFRYGQLLDEPDANLQLGTSFLAGLLREFGDPRLALAAYNAGPKRTREWWKGRRSDDVEAWVEQIPYDETRQYIKRVMLSWEEYRRLYGPTAASARP